MYRGFIKCENGRNAEFSVKCSIWGLRPPGKPKSGVRGKGPCLMSFEKDVKRSSGVREDFKVKAQIGKAVKTLQPVLARPRGAGTT